MSNMKDLIKQKVRAGNSVHSQLIEPVHQNNDKVNDGSSYINTNKNVDDNINKNINVNVDANNRDLPNQNRPRKKKFEEKYTRATYYIDNELLQVIEHAAGSEKGEKTRIINEALRDWCNSNGYSV